MINKKSMVIKIINDYRRGVFDDRNIQNICINYNAYPLNIIKYTITNYPVIVSSYIIHYIIATTEKKCEIINYILRAHQIQLCDNYIIKKKTCNVSCTCYSRKYWSILYNYFIKLFEYSPLYFVQSKNIKYCFKTLILKTDVVDFRLIKILDNLSKNKLHWDIILNFIYDAKLYASSYRHIIINMRLIKDVSLFNLVMNKYTDTHNHITKIIEYTYISNIYCATNVSIIKNKNIEYIVSLTRQNIFKIRNVKYIHLRIDDIQGTNFIHITHHTVDRIINFIKNKKNVLIHCNKGISRSVCFMIFILIKQGMCIDDALYLVRSKCIHIDPNPTFIDQLKLYNKNVFIQL